MANATRAAYLAPTAKNHQEKRDEATIGGRAAASARLSKASRRRCRQLMLVLMLGLGAVGRQLLLLLLVLEHWQQRANQVGIVKRLFASLLLQVLKA